LLIRACVRGGAPGRKCVTQKAPGSCQQSGTIKRGRRVRARESWSNCSCTFRRPDPQGAACAPLCQEFHFQCVFSAPRRASGRPRRKGAKSCCSIQTWEFSFQRRAKLNANAHVRAAGNRWGDDEKTSEKVEQGNDFCKLLQL
jgi:hypothetical protein